MFLFVFRYDVSSHVYHVLIKGEREGDCGHTPSGHIFCYIMAENKLYFGEMKLMMMTMMMMSALY